MKIKNAPIGIAFLEKSDFQAMASAVSGQEDHSVFHRKVLKMRSIMKNFAKNGVGDLGHEDSQLGTETDPRRHTLAVITA